MSPLDASEAERATYVPVLDKGEPDERFGLLNRRKYKGNADTWAADFGSFVDRLAPGPMPDWLRPEPKETRRRHCLTCTRARQCTPIAFGSGAVIFFCKKN